MVHVSDNQPKGISWLRVLLVLLLLAGTWWFLRGTSGTHPTPILRPLATFPQSLGDWRVQSQRQSSDAVIKMLGVDDYIEYTYANPTGQSVNLYVAFYESVGTSGGYHSPKNCIPGGGWGIDTIKTVEIHSPKRGAVTVSEMLVRNGNQYQVVLYWYQNRGRIIASEYWEKIYLVWDAILKQRRDGAFVRLMAPALNGNIQQAEKNVQEIAEQAVDTLDFYLPGK